MKFTIDSFMGIRPKISTLKLDKNMAEIAENCDLQSGSLAPLESPAIIEAIAYFPARGIYADGSDIMTWTTRTHVCKSPIADDSHKRIYYADGVLPKVTGLLENVKKTFTLGVPRPDFRPIVKPVAKSTNWTQKWKFFYEGAAGERLEEVDLPDTVAVANAAKTTFTIQAANLPARISAPTTAPGVVWMEGFDEYGLSMGVLYTAPSSYTVNNTLIVNGGTITCTRSYNPGFTVLTLNLVSDVNTSVGANYNVDRYYVYTFVSAYGEEGAPSDPSALVMINGTQNVLVSNLRDTPFGYENIAKVRIYRTVVGETATNFRFVAEFDVGNSQYLDQTPDSETGETLQSEGWDAPPNDLTGIRMHPGGFMAGWSAANPRTLLLSVTNQPHAWNAAYSMSFDHDIVGIGVSGNSLVICTKGYPYLLTGDAPDSMSKSMIPLPQGCVSGQGVAEHENTVIYPSPDGLVVVDGANARLVTGDYYSRTEWAAINPQSMVAAIYDNRYLGFTTTGGIIFGLTEAKYALTTTTQTATAVYYDPESDRLLLADGASVLVWRSGSTRMTSRWRSRVLDLARPWNFSVARVSAQSFPVTLRLYMDDTNVYEEDVEDDQAFRLPVFGDAKNWQLEVECKSIVDQIDLTTSMTEL